MLNRKIRLIKRIKIEDNRGYFLKVINGLEEHLPKHTGEVYITKANPGEIKGGHYHLKAMEWFTIIKGNCKVKLMDIENKEVQEIILDETEVFTLFVPNYIAHSFTNMSTDKEFVLLAYSSELFDPSDTVSLIF